jgi:putrescine transport system permease protein
VADARHSGRRLALGVLPGGDVRRALRGTRKPGHVVPAGPVLEPARLERRYLRETLHDIFTGGQYLTVFLRTVAYVAIAIVLSLAIGYPVAYYAARHAGRWRGTVLLLLVLPFWINYLMRMLAWINLLSPGG